MAEVVKYDRPIASATTHIVSSIKTTLAQVEIGAASMSGPQKKANDAFAARLKKAIAALEIKA